MPSKFRRTSGAGLDEADLLIARAASDGVLGQYYDGFDCCYTGGLPRSPAGA